MNKQIKKDGAEAMSLCRLAALTIACTAGLAHAQDMFSYKGVTLGTPIAEYQATFPDHPCRGNSCSYDAQACSSSAAGLYGGAHTAAVQTCTDRSSFGGAYVSFGTADFRDGKLVHINLTIPSGHIDGLFAALRERYGTPKSMSDEPFTSRGGVTSPNVLATWETGDAVLQVVRHSFRLGSGNATLSTKAEIEQRAADRAATAKKSAKDF